MKTMTIRNIPDDVVAGLAARANETGRSMNATVVAALTDAFGEKHQKPENDFSEFCGTWTKEEADAIEKEIEEVFEKVDVDEYKPWLHAPEGKK